MYRLAKVRAIALTFVFFIHLVCLASSHPRSIAKWSRLSVPFSCIAIATPSAIQRAG